MIYIAKHVLIKYYLEEKRTIPETAKILGVSTGKVCNDLKKYNIKTRTQSEVMRARHNSPEIPIKKCKNCNKNTKLSKPSKPSVFCSNKCYGKWRSKNLVGKHATNYKHGKCGKLLYIRANKIYRNWVLAIFKRDNFTCQRCGDNKGGNLQAHHIKSFAKICHENKIYSVKAAKKCKTLWDINNGITLCKKCHKKTKNYGYNKHTKTNKI